MALSLSPDQLKEKVFRNVSANRRREIEDRLSPGRWGMARIREARRIIGQLVYQMTGQEAIAPPPLILHQIERFETRRNAQVQSQAANLIDRGAFYRLLAELSPQEISRVIRSVSGEEMLWLLKGCDSEAAGILYGQMTDLAVERFKEDLDSARVREAEPDEAISRTVLAMLKAMDAARLQMSLRWP